MFYHVTMFFFGPALVPHPRGPRNGRGDQRFGDQDGTKDFFLWGPRGDQRFLLSRPMVCSLMFWDETKSGKTLRDEKENMVTGKTINRNYNHMGKTYFQLNFPGKSSEWLYNQK